MDDEHARVHGMVWSKSSGLERGASFKLRHLPTMNMKQSAAPRTRATRARPTAPWVSGCNCGRGLHFTPGRRNKGVVRPPPGDVGVGDGARHNHPTRASNM